MPVQFARLNVHELDMDAPEKLANARFASLKFTASSVARLKDAPTSEVKTKSWLRGKVRPVIFESEKSIPSILESRKLTPSVWISFMIAPANKQSTNDASSNRDPASEATEKFPLSKYERKKYESNMAARLNFARSPETSTNEMFACPNRELNEKSASVKSELSTVNMPAKTAPLNVAFVRLLSLIRELPWNVASCIWERERSELRMTKFVAVIPCIFVCTADVPSIKLSSNIAFCKFASSSRTASNPIKLNVVDMKFVPVKSSPRYV